MAPVIIITILLMGTKLALMPHVSSRCFTDAVFVIQDMFRVPAIKQSQRLYSIAHVRLLCRTLILLDPLPDLTLYFIYMPPAALSLILFPEPTWGFFYITFHWSKNFPVLSKGQCFSFSFSFFFFFKPSGISVTHSGKAIKYDLRKLQYENMWKNLQF